MTRDAEAPVVAGGRMLEEIGEQPARVRDALDAAIPQLGQLAAAVHGADYTVLLGRGSSRSAATYGARAISHQARRPAVVASPAELAWGNWALPLERALVVAISQSGESVEMVAAARRARESGARVVVVTNTADSTLAEIATRADTLLCRAGDETAVPATKSFTTSVACLLAIASASRRRAVEAARDQLPALLETVLADRRVTELTFGRLDSFVLAGEGYGEAVAEESAIKLRETLSVPVASFETSELLHGSINSTGPGMGVVTFETDELSRGLAREVAAEAGRRGAMTVHVGPEPLEGVSWVPLPKAPPEWLALLAIVPIQLAARATALARGLDPDAPAGLTKVTLIGYDAGA
jgi:glutamine---fructose-6-phosphate transaminase (isomerizing)